MSRGKVLCAMSGGVDSSVAAWLLKEQGYEVIGLTMKTWARDHKAGQKSCCGIDAVDDAARVAAQVDIPYIALDMEQVFRETVIDNFTSEYLKGRTPNPCIVCNYKLKFGYLLQKADEFDCTHVATGHYGRLEFEDGRYRILKGVDEDKDQSYVLYNLTQEQLSRTLLPLGGFTKDKIRAIAKERNFTRVMAKPDSVGICFVTDSYKDYLRGTAKERLEPGPLVDVHGNQIGTHQGIALYTIGQRKGLGISLPDKTFVTHIDKEKNTVTVGPREFLLRRNMEIHQFNWVASVPTLEPFRALVKIRYHHKPVMAEIHPQSEKQIQVVFDEPQEAVAPGQSAVLYDGDVVLAGGIIEACS